MTPPDNPNELRKIGEWLLVFQTEFNNLIPREPLDKDIIDDINALINAWISEIRKGLKLQPDESLDDPNVKISGVYRGPASNYIANYKIYQALLKPLMKEDRTSGAISDILLEVQRGNYNSFNEVIVISEGLLTDPQMRIYDNQHLINLAANARTCIASYFKDASGQKIGNKADLTTNNDIWIRPEKYFLTDVLLKGQNGSILTENEKDFNVDKGKFILPFRKEILNFFSPEYIVEKCRPEYSTPDGGNTIIFTFYLPVKSNGTTLDVKFERVYKGGGAVPSSDEGLIHEIQVPVVDMFPNYLDTNWRRYYLFQSNADRYNVKPVNPMPVKEVDGKPILTPPTVEQKEFKDMSIKYKQQVRITVINGNKAFPEALEFMKVSGELLGMVLLQKPSQEPAALSGKWTIGIDFGTSNTTVYIHDDQNADVMNMNLARHFRRVTRCGDDEEQYLIHNYFVPCREITLPFPTTLRVYNEAFQEKMLLDYIIYFPLETEYNLPSNVYGDIKWDGTTDKTKGFLTNLVFLILIEAIAARKKTLRFEYSFPKSFTDSYKNNIVGIWAEIFEKLTVKNSVSSSFKTIAGQENPTWPVNSADDMIIDEGFATGRYFGSPDTNKESYENVILGAICLDVGGGTTDISVWGAIASGGTGIIMDTSVLMAGREFSELFRGKPALRRTLFPEAACAALDEKDTDARQFGTRLNVILRREDEFIKRKLVSSLNDKYIEELKQFIALEFCGFAYFSALMTVAANEQNGGRLKERIDGDEGIGVYWGGKGASFISWLDNGVRNSAGIAFKVLGNVYGQALKRFDIPMKLTSFKHIQSTAPKHEVAGGLVIDREFGFTPSDKNDGMSGIDDDGYTSPTSQSQVGLFICGVELTLRDGREIKATDRIAEADIYDDRQLLVKTINYDNIKHCVDILNTVAVQLGIYKQAKKIDFEKYKPKMSTRVLAELTKQAGRGPGNRTIEPIFIMGMRELFKILSA
ncbi:MAG: hypothetical protein HQK89_05355 [Nitrospirae bacterium]|nr:hypothetical protein [Nitrospirota bacterium]